MALFHFSGACWKLKANFMDTLQERIVFAIKAAGFTQAEVARQLGAKPQTVQGWIKTGTISRDNLAKLARLTGRDIEWFQLGGHHLEQARSAYQLDTTKYALIPRYDVLVGAGEPPHNGEHEEISGRHAFRRDWLERKGLAPGRCAVIEAVGESMMPTINDGDVLLVNLDAKRVSNGDAYAFRTEDGPRVKRLFKQLDGRVRVVSDNPDKLKYPDEFLTPGMEAEIIGQVVHRSGGV